MHGKSKSGHKKSDRITFKTSRDFMQGGNAVLSVLGACIKSGDEIEMICEGEDETEALQAMVTAIENGLGE